MEELRKSLNYVRFFACLTSFLENQKHRLYAKSLKK